MGGCWAVTLLLLDTARSGGMAGVAIVSGVSFRLLVMVLHWVTLLATLPPWLKG